VELNQRLNPGELVQIRGGVRYQIADLEPGKEAVGLIVEVLERNEQNPEWDKYLVMWGGCIDALPGRRLKQVNLEKLSQFVQKELNTS